MAVAVSSANFNSAPTLATSLSFAFTNAGNAFCMLTSVEWGALGYEPLTTVTCNGSTITSDFSNDWYLNYVGTNKGFHKLNSSGVNNIVITTVPDPDGFNLGWIHASVICLSGVGSYTSSNAVSSLFSAFDDTNQTYSLTVTSKVNDLVIGIDFFDGVDSYPVSMSPVWTQTPFWYNQTVGASPSASFSGTYFAASTDAGFGGYGLYGWSFSPSSSTIIGGVTIVSGVTDTGDVSMPLGVSVNHTGVTIKDFT